jgi:hypothetical protein
MTQRPQIVLVHGAWADGSSCGQIMTALGTDAPNAVALVYVAELLQCTDAATPPPG